jgi:hypothetical protein
MRKAGFGAEFRRVGRAAQGEAATFVPPDFLVYQPWNVWPVRFGAASLPSSESNAFLTDADALPETLPT